MMRINIPDALQTCVWVTALPEWIGAGTDIQAPIPLIASRLQPVFQLTARCRPEDNSKLQ
jgi:hypothetical protein